MSSTYVTLTRATQGYVAAGTRGPSHPFWVRVQTEMNDRGMSLRELVDRSGVAHTVIASLKTSGIRDRARRRDNVLALAGVLDIPRDEALQLAGLVATPLDPNVDVRDAIRRSAEFDDDQKEALYRLIDVFERDRRDRRGRDAQTG